VQAHPKPTQQASGASELTLWTVPATVERVIDGDTAVLLLDLGWHCYRRERCRFASIDTPELPTDAGMLARNATESLLPVGTPVTFESHSLDGFGRPLGRVLRADGMDVGAELIRLGYAQPYKR
jgi:endonuclease YncB( thermonuclease family)